MGEKLIEISTCIVRPILSIVINNYIIKEDLSRTCTGKEMTLNYQEFRLKWGINKLVWNVIDREN